MLKTDIEQRYMYHKAPTFIPLPYQIRLLLLDQQVCSRVKLALLPYGLRSKIFLVSVSLGHGVQGTSVLEPLNLTFVKCV